MWVLRRKLLLGASVAALVAASGDSYAANSISPELVADFATEYFRKAGSTSTYADIFTHSRSGNATMVDSDGYLKWAPHNLNSNSATLGVQGAATLTTGQSDPWGGTRATQITAGDGSFEGAAFGGITPSGDAVFRIWAKAGTASWVAIRPFSKLTAHVYFNLSTGVKGTQQADAASASITAAGNGYYLLEVTLTKANVSAATSYIYVANADNSGLACNTGEYVYAVGPHSRENSLGGTVSVPSDLRVDSSASSYLETTGSARYLARRNHHVWNGSSWVNEGALIETSSRTNIALRSIDYTTWNDTGLDITNAFATGPDGNSSLAKLAITNTTSTTHSLYTAATVSMTSAATYTHSVWLKNGNQRYVILQSFRSANNWSSIVVDLQTGSVTQTSTGASSGTISGYGVIDCGGGLYRVWLASAESGTAGYPATLVLASTGTPTLDTNGQEVFSGTAGNYILAGQPQLELGSTPSSYMPTSGATFTRAADSLSAAYANIPTISAVAMEGRVTYADLGSAAQFAFWRQYKDADEYLLCDMDTDSTDTGEVNWEQNNAGTSATVTSDTYSPGVFVEFNIASRHATSAIQGAAGGTAATADTTSSTKPTFTTAGFEIGSGFNGTIRTLRLWSSDIAQAGIEEASA